MSSYEPKTTGICPHCRIGVQFITAKRTNWYGGVSSKIWDELFATGDEVNIQVYSSLCPECKKPIVMLRRRNVGDSSEPILEERMVYPANIVRIAPPEVPQSIRDDFLEAAAVLSISEKASAALARRCL